MCERVKLCMNDLVNTHSTWLGNKTPWTIKTTYTHCDWLIGVSDKHDTWDRHSNDHENTLATMLTTSCVSLIDVYITNTSHSQPSTSSKWGLNDEITINMPKTTFGQTSEKEARHVEETHTITFRVCTHACYWGKDDMKLTIHPTNSNKRCTSKGVLYLPYLPSIWSCIRRSLHVVLIFSIAWFLGPSP